MSDEMINNPDANPILFAVCNFFFAGALGSFLLGQPKKAAFTVVIFCLTCWGMCGILNIVMAIDAYKLGEKLQSGESISKSENGLSFLDFMPW